jgi:hypothetical protein
MKRNGVTVCFIVVVGWHLSCICWIEFDRYHTGLRLSRESFTNIEKSLLSVITSKFSPMLSTYGLWTGCNLFFFFCATPAMTWDLGICGPPYYVTFHNKEWALRTYSDPDLHRGLIILLLNEIQVITKWEIFHSTNIFHCNCLDISTNWNHSHFFMDLSNMPV